MWGILFLLVLIIGQLGLIFYVIYYSFFMPERERRAAFAKLTAEEVEDLRATMTAEHFFRLTADQKLPSFKIKLTKKSKIG